MKVRSRATGALIGAAIAITTALGAAPAAYADTAPVVELIVDYQFTKVDAKTIQLRFRYSTGGVVSTTNWIQASVVGTSLSQSRGGTW